MTKAEMEGVIWDLQKKLSAAEAKFEAARLEIHRQEEYSATTRWSASKFLRPIRSGRGSWPSPRSGMRRGGLHAGCAKSLVGAMSNDARP